MRSKDVAVGFHLFDCKQIAPDRIEAALSLRPQARRVVRLRRTVQRNLVVGDAAADKTVIRFGGEQKSVRGHAAQQQDVMGLGDFLGVSHHLAHDLAGQGGLAAEPIDLE
jgi:hypothetical protein